MSSPADLKTLQPAPIEAASRRWRQRPAGSNWGDFGEDDELGRLNYLTPDVRKLLGKLWSVSELATARHSRRYFLLTAPPLRLPDAVGSPVTPVATV